MPFIGNQPALSYTSFAKQDFTTSATTSYTLNNPVANANELALFINFVRQEPTTAYSASGTNLTLTSATSATDDMYCVFLGKAVQTVNPPNGSITSSMLASGDLTIPSGNLLFDTANKGIYLGVTSATASNLLDDYEEGTWTPTLENGVVSYTSQTGQYIKVGKLVYFQGTIVLSSNNTADTSSVRIGSLPFTVDTTNNSALFTMDASGSTLFDNYHNVGGASFTSPNNINIGDTSNNTQIQYADLQSSGTMVFSGQYIAS